MSNYLDRTKREHFKCESDHPYKRATNEALFDFPDEVVILENQGKGVFTFKIYDKDWKQEVGGTVLKGKKFTKQYLWKLFKRFRKQSQKY